VEWILILPKHKHKQWQSNNRPRHRHRLISRLNSNRLMLKLKAVMARVDLDPKLVVMEDMHLADILERCKDLNTPARGWVRDMERHNLDLEM
jgi:hypothetical protein